MLRFDRGETESIKQIRCLLTQQRLTDCFYLKRVVREAGLEPARGLAVRT